MKNLRLGDWSTGATAGTHDIVIDGNGAAESVADLRQRVDVRLRTFLGEHWLNPELGVPWFTEFLVKSPDLRVCRQALATVLQEVPGVVSIESLVLSLEKAPRRMIISFRVSGLDTLGTVAAPIIVEGETVVPFFVVGSTGEFVSGGDSSLLFGT